MTKRLSAVLFSGMLVSAKIKPLSLAEGTHAAVKLDTVRELLRADNIAEAKKLGKIYLLSPVLHNF